MVIPYRCDGTCLWFIDHVCSIKATTHTAFKHCVINIFLCKLKESYHFHNLEECDIKVLALNCIKYTFSVSYQVFLTHDL